jgi:DNA recombination protein RmuC
VVYDLILVGAAGLLIGLEAGLIASRYHHRRAALVASSGYQAELAVLESRLAERAAESDRRNHLVDELSERLAVREREVGQLRVEEAGLISVRDEQRARYDELQSRHDAMRRECEALRVENVSGREQLMALRTTLDEQAKQAEEKLALLDRARESMNDAFKATANDIFEARQQAFKAESSEQLTGLLDPLSRRISEFEKRVADSYSQESKERFSLIKEVRSLQELNDRISRDAINLTNALKGENKTQGSWGEVVLERVLERSGLTRGREYEVQVNLRNAEGRKRQPDVVVHLPEAKDVVIDSKVSLTAYERYSSTDDEAEQARAIKLHVASLRRHLKMLSAKDYHQLDGVKSLDFVLLFIPIEAAFAVAVQHDPGLFSDGFDQNIVIVSPSTLLATLRTIQNIWRYEDQNRNAQEIAERAGALYDKFVNFVGDLETIGTRIDAVASSYADAHNKLISGRGSLVRRAESMRELGARTSKTLPRNLVEMPREMPRREPSIRSVPAEKQ